MKLKIVSDGTPRKTQVLTESGENLSGVTALFWKIRAGDNLARLVIEMDPALVDVELLSDVDIIYLGKNHHD